MQEFLARSQLGQPGTWLGTAQWSGCAPAARQRRSVRRASRPPHKAAFLEALEAGWPVAEAAVRVGIGRRSFYRARERDERFAEQWDAAFAVGTEFLEAELRRRALDGWDEDTFDGAGELVRRTRRRAPHDLYKLLAARDSRFKDGAQVAVQATAVALPPIRHEFGLTLADVVAFAEEHGLGGVTGKLITGDGEAGQQREPLALPPAGGEA
jgi:hypothetical protein